MSLEFRGHRIAPGLFGRLRGEPPQPDGTVARPSDRGLALALLALLYAVYLATFSGTYHSSDEMAMLVATDSLARRGEWDVELLRWMGQQQGSFGPDGHLYSRKGIGMTLAALPHYWLALQIDSVGNVQAGMLTDAAVTALTGVLVFLALRRLGYGRAASLLSALAYGLGTMAWPYARYFFSEPLAALGLMAAFYFLLRFRDEQDHLSPLLAGAGLGLALLARLNNALAAPLLGLLLLAYLYRRHGRRWQGYVAPVLLFGLPLLAALGVSGWYNWLRFGNPLTTGYLPEESFATPFFQGLYGLTLSWGKGLFWYNPLLIAAVAAWPAFYRRHRTEAALAAAVVLTTLFFYAPWYLWWAGHGWGPRFLVSLLPFATLPLATALELAGRHRNLALALGALAAASMAIQVLGVAVDFNLYLEDAYAELGLYHPATLFEPAYSPLVRQWAYLRPGNLDLAWTHIEPAGLGPLYVLLPVLLALAVLWSAWRRRLAPHGVGWAGWGLLLALAVYTLPYLLALGPEGDVAAAARELAALERPGEVAVVANSGLTEAFQDAYDGGLAMWGVPDRGQVPLRFQSDEGTWVLSAELPDAAPLRFQAGEVGLVLYPAAGAEVGPRPLPAPPAMVKAGHSLGGLIELAGAQMGATSVAPDGSLAVSLWWRALASIDVSYTVFMQVIDEAGTKAGQVDRLPCDGGCPTTAWQPGDLVGARYEVAIDPAAPPGRYRVIAGLYDLATGQRLPVVDAAGAPAADHLLLGSVDIR